MRSPARSPTKRRLPSWSLILFGILVCLAWVSLSGKYQNWMARREYAQRYSTALELPDNISLPRASFQRMPGVVGKALWVDFLQDASEDEKLRTWFVKHSGFSEFKSEYPLFPKPTGMWKASRGSQFLIMYRQDENGWVHLTLGQRMPPDEAEKDLATFTWKSEMQAWKSERDK